MSRRRVVSVDEKRARVLQFFYERVFMLLIFYMISEGFFHN